MTKRTRVGRRAPILLLVALAAVATIALADVIFVYTGTINVQPMTTQPLVFSTGPNAGPSNTAAEPYINFTGRLRRLHGDPSNNQLLGCLLLRGW